MGCGGGKEADKGQASGGAKPAEKKADAGGAAAKSGHHPLSSLASFDFKRNHNNSLLR